MLQKYQIYYIFLYCKDNVPNNIIIHWSDSKTYPIREKKKTSKELCLNALGDLPNVSICVLDQF